MPSYIPAKKNIEFITYISLPSIASAGIAQVNPTIATGDFKVSIDGGTLNNLATIPVVTPSGGKLVKVTLSASEMNGDNITLVASDVAGGEWEDVIKNIPTSTNQIDDLATSDQLGAITNVSSAVNKPAESYVLTTGTQSANTFAATEALDGTNHEHTDDADAMDLYYEFLLGAGTPSSVTVTGYLTGVNDSLEVHGFDWASSSWKQIGTLVGKALSSNEVNSYTLFVNMVGTGVNLGKVRIRFTDGVFTLTTATLAIDQIFVTFSQSSEGYESGAIWIDTNASNTNTVVGVDGTASNPVSTLSAAVTLSASTNLNSFRLAPNSNITLVSTFNNYLFSGEDWVLALNGQDCGGSHFRGAQVSGTATGATEMHFHDCSIGTINIPASHIEDCGFTATATLEAAGDYTIVNCYSEVAGSAAPVFDVGTTAATNTSLHFRQWSGGVDLRNLGQVGTDLVSIEGDGNVILNANCVGGSLAIRGNFTLTDNSATTTITDGARYEESSVVDAVWDELLTGSSHNIQNSAGKRVRQTQEIGVYEGGQIWIDTVNGTAGSTSYENGTVDLPVDNITDAMILSAALGIKRFKISPNSSITLGVATNNFVFDGDAWALDLGGQDVSDSNFIDADLSGICTGAVPHFHGCRMDGVTIPPSNLYNCGMTGDMTGGSAGDYAFIDCYSHIAGTATPSFDFGAAVGNTNLSMRHYSGGMEIKNMGTTGTDKMSLEGDGQLVINADCAAGTVAIRGNFTVTDNAGGALTLSDDARYDVTRISTELDELHKLEGLDSANPVTTTPKSRVAGSISQVITGDGITTSTVTRP